MINLFFRNEEYSREEYEIAKQVWGAHRIATQRVTLKNQQVIGRYSVLPRYEELYNDLVLLGSTLIHTPSQFEICADFRKWYPFLKELTPKSWWDVGYMTAPETEHGWIVKGITNSKKNQWNTHMFARTRADLKQVVQNLSSDTFIGSQDLIYREYIPLEKVEDSINGLQASNEWRIFIWKDKILASGYYWSWVEEPPTEMPSKALELVEKAIALFKSSGVIFYVLDVAKDVHGKWWLIEVNEGQMSGLNSIDPEEFYQNLFKAAHVE